MVLASVSLRHLLPSFVAAADVTDVGQEVTLHLEEARHVKSGVAKRRREFALGRWCAHRALEQVGYEDAILAVRSDRTPRWPTGIVGSITHTDGYAAALVAEQCRFSALGVDAERSGHFGRDLWAMIFDDAEIDWLLRRDGRTYEQMATVIFSAKEAYYKADYSLYRRWLDFHDVHIDIEGQGFRVTERRSVQLSGRKSPAVGRYAIVDDLILTAICLQT